MRRKNEGEVCRIYRWKTVIERRLVVGASYVISPPWGGAHSAKYVGRTCVLLARTDVHWTCGVDKVPVLFPDTGRRCAVQWYHLTPIDPPPKARPNA